MITVQWTERAESDLGAIHAFIEADSPHYASVVVGRLLHAVDRLHAFPQSGRLVPDSPILRFARSFFDRFASCIESSATASFTS